MKEFPQESIEQARWVVGKYRKRANSKLEIAAQLYDNKFVQINYGFSEAVKKGNCGLFFHEIDKECDCFTYLGVAYLIAKESSLSPRMWWGIGIKDVDEGEDINETRSLDHGFISAEVSKNKTFIIDRQMGLYGLAKFNEKNSIIEVYDKQNRKITYRHYQNLTELSEEEYLRRLEENRSSKGGRIVLSTTQRIKGAGNRNIYLSYSRQTHKLKASARLPTIRFSPDSYNKVLVIDLETGVNKDGSYDFRDGELSFYHASIEGWAEHENPQVPIVLQARDVEKVWRVWDKLFLETGRKSPFRKDALRVMEMIKDNGFSDSFSVKAGSKASNAIKVNSLERILEEFQIAQKKATNTYVQKIPEETISYKSLLRYAHYVKAYDQAVSKKNPKGFIFSEAEHLALLEKEVENFKESTWRIYNTLIEQMKIRTGLEKGSLYQTDRKWNISFAQELRNTRYLDIMGPLYKSRFPLAFHISADRELSMRQFDIDKMSVIKLKKGLTQKDIKRASQHRLFEWLVGSYVIREALFLASYKKGLQKILDRRGD